MQAILTMALLPMALPTKVRHMEELCKLVEEVVARLQADPNLNPNPNHSPAPAPTPTPTPYP